MTGHLELMNNRPTVPTRKPQKLNDSPASMSWATFWRKLTIFIFCTTTIQNKVWLLHSKVKKKRSTPFSTILKQLLLQQSCYEIRSTITTLTTFKGLFASMSFSNSCFYSCTKPRGLWCFKVTPFPFWIIFSILGCLYFSLSFMVPLCSWYSSSSWRHILLWRSSCSLLCFSTAALNVSLSVD